jgi:hypothetical protein
MLGELGALLAPLGFELNHQGRAFFLANLQALDIEQGVDPPDRFECHRRDLKLRPASRLLLEIGELEKNFLRLWAQHSAGVIGPSSRLGSSSGLKPE